MGTFSSTFGNTFVQQLTLLNSTEYPDNAVVTKSGKYITSVDGKFILTVDGFVPLNALRTLTGNPVVTKSGNYITI